MFSRYAPPAEMIQWKVNCSRYNDDEIMQLIPVPHRKREEMEIVPVVLVHKDL